MAVVDGPTNDTKPATEGGGKGKITKKKRNMYVGLAAAGLGVLLLAHKGGKGSTGQGNGEELQPIIDEPVKAPTRVIPSSQPPDVSGSGESSESPGAQSPGITAPGTSPSAASIENAQVGAVVGALDKNAEAIQEDASATKEDAKQDGGTIKRGTASKHKAKPKSHKAKRTTRATHHTGVTVDGRHFPGAVGHRRGASHISGGMRHTIHHINYGGRTDVHMSHNGGQHWTDHVPGHTAPSRSAHAHSHPATHHHPHHRRSVGV